MTDELVLEKLNDPIFLKELIDYENSRGNEGNLYTTFLSFIERVISFKSLNCVDQERRKVGTLIVDDFLSNFSTTFIFDVDDSVIIGIKKHLLEDKDEVKLNIFDLLYFYARGVLADEVKKYMEVKTEEDGEKKKKLLSDRPRGLSITNFRDDFVMILGNKIRSKNHRMLRKLNKDKKFLDYLINLSLEDNLYCYIAIDNLYSNENVDKDILEQEILSILEKYFDFTLNEENTNIPLSMSMYTGMEESEIVQNSSLGSSGFIFNNLNENNLSFTMSTKDPKENKCKINVHTKYVKKIINDFESGLISKTIFMSIYDLLDTFLTSEYVKCEKTKKGNKNESSSNVI